MKEIKKTEVEALLKQGIIFNTVQGYLDKRGYRIGYYRTRNKRYIEDKYADIAKRLS